MSYLFSPGVAFIVTLFCIIAIRPVAIKLGLVDIPGGRKLHSGSVPLIGGIAIFFGIGFGLLTLDTSLMPYRSLVAAMGLLLFLGILDDAHELSAKVKLLGQIIAALIISVWGHSVLYHLGNLLGLGSIHLGSLSLPFTVVAIVGLINAVNLVDGVDGLAGSMLLVQTLALMLCCLFLKLYSEARFLSVIVASLLGFLTFNFPIGHYQKRRIFMGDAGSMVLGLLLAWFAIKLTQGQGAVLKPVFMVWIMAFPLLEIGASIIRRLLKGRSPFYPDKLHLHHLLLRGGYSARATTLMISLFSLVMASLGLLFAYLQVPDGLMFLLFAFVFLSYLYLLRNAWRIMKLLKHRRMGKRSSHSNAE